MYLSYFLRNFTLKNYLFGATNIVKKWVYSGYGIAFDETSMWSFGNNYVLYLCFRNVIIPAIDSSSSSHTDNCRNNSLVLSEGDTFGINGGLSAPKNKFSINFSEAKTKFCMSWYYNGDNSCLFVSGKVFKFKEPKLNLKVMGSLFLRSISNRFDTNESREISFERNLYDFSVDYNSFDKPSILNINEYLMFKRKIK